MLHTAGSSSSGLESIKSLKFKFYVGLWPKKRGVFDWFHFPVILWIQASSIKNLSFFYIFNITSKYPNVDTVWITISQDNPRNDMPDKS